VVRAVIFTTPEAILFELAKHLSPGNENVKCGDIIASIRDLAQIALAATENIEDSEKAVKRLSLRLGIERQYRERMALCPDHRDKANGICIACQAEKRTREEMRLEVSRPSGLMTGAGNLVSGVGSPEDGPLAGESKAGRS
jgi:hypothetical protein